MKLKCSLDHREGLLNLEEIGPPPLSRQTSRIDTERGGPKLSRIQVIAHQAEQAATIVAFWGINVCQAAL